MGKDVIDERLVPTRCPRPERLRKLGLRGFATSVEPEYWGEHALQVTRVEATAYNDAAEELYGLFERCTGDLLAGPFRAEFGLSPKLWSLAALTWRERARHPHLYGRFDLSGVIDGTPAKLIEFNADSATVLAEAARVMQWQNRGSANWNDIDRALEEQIREKLVSATDDVAPLALIVTLGYPEDDDNALVLQEACTQAGLETHVAHLPTVTFAPGEGVFRELNADEWLRYDIVIKIVPWDWIDREEPELLDFLDQLIRGGEVRVFNPPYTALMQSKAMLAHLHEQFAGHAHLLAAGLGLPPATVADYVLKPLWGCEGADVQVRRAGCPPVRSEGDGTNGPPIWQTFTQLPRDSADWVYQAGVYWAGVPCGLAYRRSGSLIVDAQSQFIGQVLD